MVILLLVVRDAGLKTINDSTIGLYESMQDVRESGAQFENSLLEFQITILKMQLEECGCEDTLSVLLPLKGK